MRSCLQVLLFSLVLIGLYGCGPKYNDPKPVDVKEDPNLKRAGSGGDQKAPNNNVNPVP